MKSIKWVSIAVLASLPAMAIADDTRTVRYTGDNLGKQICKAVADDDVARLKLALRTYKQSLASSYSFDSAGREVARDFTCNGMDVQAFSQHMRAAKVAGFFSGATEHQVAVSGS